MSLAAQLTHRARSSGGMAAAAVNCTASSTSPLRKAGAIIASSDSRYSLARLGMGVLARKASESSAAHTSSLAQWCAPKMTTRENPIFHTSIVERLRGKLKSHGSSSPGGTSGLGATRGVACPSLRRRANEGSSARALRGVRSDADTGRCRSCDGLRLGTILRRARRGQSRRRCAQVGAQSSS
jgi:hypothetical protein